MESKRLIREIWKKYPKNLQEDFDFCGYQAGNLKKETKKILVVLDFDSLAYPFAEKVKPDLIITHHPFLFGTRYRVFTDDQVRKETCLKVENELHSCIYSFHTCFDKAAGGMNDALAEALQLEDLYAPEKVRYMRIGNLKMPMKREDFVKYALERLNASYGLFMGYGKEEIQKVALVGGGASKDYLTALEEGADIYLSGDAAHHTRREIAERSFNYLDLPHEIERIFIPTMKKALLSIDPTLEVICLDHEEDAKAYLRN